MTKSNHPQKKPPGVTGLTALALAAYAFLWFFPWQPWLAAVPWVQFILGVLLFIIPGLGLSLLVMETPVVLHPRSLAVGMAFSVGLASLLGLLARWLDLTFVWVSAGLFLAGAISWGAVLLLKSLRLYESFPWKPGAWLSALTLLALIILVLVCARMSIPPLIYEDDFTYNAQLYYFQTAESYRGVTAMDNLEPARFQLAFWPLVEALLSQLSGLDGLLVTGVYIAPVLVVLSATALYALSQSLGLSPPVAAVVVAAQLASLVRLTLKNQPGTLFFNRFPEDKVAATFVLAPVVFLLVFEYLELPRKRTLLLLLGATLGLGLSHPVVLGFTSMIAGLGGLWHLFKRPQIKPLVPVALVLALVVAMPMGIRVFERQRLKEFTMTEALDAGRENKLSSGRLNVLENEFFYGIAPDILNGLPYELFFLAGALALLRLKKSVAAALVTASLTALALATWPYTGWIIGYAVTPFQVWRLTWLMPFGLGVGLLVESAFELVLHWLPKARPQRLILEKGMAFALVVGFTLGSLYILPWARGNLDYGGRKPGTLAWYQDYLDLKTQLTPEGARGAVFLGGPDRTTNDILPSLYPDISLVSFRNERGGNTAPLWEAMVGDSTPSDQRLALFQENHIQFLLVREEPTGLDQMLTDYSAHFRLLHENRKLRLYEFVP